MENERVTATDETPQKTKNPKKVAAGKAAYAARKEKEAKMLEDLQNAKKSLRDSPKEFKEPALKLSESRSPVASKLFIDSTLLWTTGLIGLGAVACYYYFQSNKISPAEKDFTSTKSHSILKTSPQSNINDPFYM